MMRHAMLKQLRTLGRGLFVNQLGSLGLKLSQSAVARDALMLSFIERGSM